MLLVESSRALAVELELYVELCIPSLATLVLRVLLLRGYYCCCRTTTIIIVSAVAAKGSGEPRREKVPSS